jgi:hypothetical protein
MTSDFSHVICYEFITKVSTLLFTPSPWNTAPLEKLIVPQLIKKFFAFYETRRFITVFTRSLSWICRIQSTSSHHNSILSYFYPVSVRGCIQKFPDWLPAARTANGTALCHHVHLYRYFVSQSSDFCSHSPLCCFSRHSTKGKCMFL